ncbi:MAG: histone H1-like repetitive region-containing protein [Acidobacteria bacterium]|nr:histone H1-like repetitive region-containing protein [Acidobacteriota bacterium]
MIRSHVVVDGSNIATEGRTTPSLRQLDDAVTAFMADHEVDRITVIVDATFPNRIDQSERAEYEAALLAGELVTPPAGTIGRGDAFILQVAEKVDATVLSNDSFQELHATRAWIFDEGRLIGGKPVPGVGWVFSLRTPVRGPVSRRTTREARAKSPDAKDATTSPRSGAKATTTSEKSSEKSSARSTRSTKGTTDVEAQPARGRRGGAATTRPASATAPNAPERSSRRRSPRASLPPLNEPLPFLEFVAAHPIGSALTGVVESFSSHGAYIRVGGARCYSPLKLLGDPAPRAARDVLRVGEERRFAVHAIDTPRRGIDLALIAQPGVDTTAPTTATRRSTTNSTHRAPDVTSVSDARHSSASDGAVRDSSIHVVGTNEQPHGNAEEAMMAVKKSAARKTAKKAPAKKAAAKKRPAKKAPAKKAVAKKRTAKKAPAKKAAAKKRPAKKAAAKKAPAKKAAAKKRPAKKAAAKKTTAKKRPAKKAAAKKAPARKTAAKKRPAKRTARRR